MLALLTLQNSRNLTDFFWYLTLVANSTSANYRANSGPYE